MDRGEPPPSPSIGWGTKRPKRRKGARRQPKASVVLHKDPAPVLRPPRNGDTDIPKVPAPSFRSPPANMVDLATVGALETPLSPSHHHIEDAQASGNNMLRLHKAPQTVLHLDEDGSGSQVLHGDSETSVSLERKSAVRVFTPSFNDEPRVGSRKGKASWRQRFDHGARCLQDKWKIKESRHTGLYNSVADVLRMMVEGQPFLSYGDPNSPKRQLVWVHFNPFWGVCGALFCASACAPQRFRLYKEVSQRSTEIRRNAHMYPLKHEARDPLLVPLEPTGEEVLRYEENANACIPLQDLIRTRRGVTQQLLRSKQFVSSAVEPGSIAHLRRELRAYYLKMVKKSSKAKEGGRAPLPGDVLLDISGEADDIGGGCHLGTRKKAYIKYEQQQRNKNVLLLESVDKIVHLEALFENQIDAWLHAIHTLVTTRTSILPPTIKPSPAHQALGTPVCLLLQCRNLLPMGMPIPCRPYVTVHDGLNNSLLGFTEWQHETEAPDFQKAVVCFLSTVDDNAELVISCWDRRDVNLDRTDLMGQATVRVASLLRDLEPARMITSARLKSSNGTELTSNGVRAEELGKKAAGRVIQLQHEFPEIDELLEARNSHLILKVVGTSLYGVQQVGQRSSGGNRTKSEVTKSNVKKKKKKKKNRAGKS